MKPDSPLQALRTVTTGRRFIPAFAAALLFFLGPAIAWGQTTWEVHMTDSLTFEPAVISILKGDTVRWVNVSAAEPHTATADSLRVAFIGGFNSGSFPTQWLEPGESFEFTFTKAGEFPYHCIPHDVFGMVGTVIVNE